MAVINWSIRETASSPLQASFVVSGGAGTYPATLYFGDGQQQTVSNANAWPITHSYSEIANYEVSLWAADGTISKAVAYAWTNENWVRVQDDRASGYALPISQTMPYGNYVRGAESAAGPYDPAAGGGDGGGGSAITVQDEGITLTNGVTKFIFVGAGVTASMPVANEVLVDIPGGGAPGSSSLEQAVQENSDAIADIVGGQYLIPNQSLSLQRDYANGQVIRVAARVGATTWDADGIGMVLLPSSAGPTWATRSMQQNAKINNRRRRMGCGSLAAAGSAAECVNSTLFLAPPLGVATDQGFSLTYAWAITDALVAGANCFFGVMADITTAIGGTGTPATLLNCIGVGSVANGLYNIYYGGSAAQTPIPLGALFPVVTDEMMSVSIDFLLSGSATVSVENLSTGVKTQVVLNGTAGTQLPSGRMGLHHFRGNGATATAVAFDTHGLSAIVY